MRGFAGSPTRLPLQAIAARQRWSAVTAAAIAALAASLGCVRLGVVGLASVVAGIALGLVGTTATSRRA